MSELTKIRKIFERLIKHITKRRSTSANIADIKLFSLIGVNALNSNLAPTTTSLLSIREEATG